jgi:hypothetical protein
MGYFDYKQRNYGVYYPPESTPFAVHQIEDVLMNGPTLPFHCFIFVDVEPSRVQVGAPVVGIIRREGPGTFDTHLKVLNWSPPLLRITLGKRSSVIQRY